MSKTPTWPAPAPYNPLTTLHATLWTGQARRGRARVSLPHVSASSAL